MGCFFAFVFINSCSTEPEQKIHIHHNELSQIPDSVFKKKNLVLLDIGLEGYTLYPPLSSLGSETPDSERPKVALTELPENLGDLSNLRSLTVSGSKIRNLPSSIIKLTKLQKLDLSMNSNLVIINELEKLKRLFNLKLLIIYGTNVSQKDLLIIKNSLSNKLRIVFTVAEFLQETNK